MGDMKQYENYYFSYYYWLKGDMKHISDKTLLKLSFNTYGINSRKIKNIFFNFLLIIFFLVEKSVKYKIETN